MADHHQSYIIGGVEFTLEANKDGSITLLPSGTLGHYHDSGELQGNDEVARAQAFLKWAIESTFDAKIKLQETDGSITYQVEKEASPLPHFIRHNKEVLDVDFFIEFMQELQKRYEKKPYLDAALATIETYQEGRRRFEQRVESSAAEDQKNAKTREHEAVAARFMVGHMLTPIRAALAYNGINAGKERREDILLALRGAHAKVPKEISASAKHYAEAIYTLLNEQILDLKNPDALKTDLTHAIQWALEQKYKDRSGFDLGGGSGKKAG